jgi:hypothetical protein
MPIGCVIWAVFPLKKHVGVISSVLQLEIAQEPCCGLSGFIQIAGNHHENNYPSLHFYGIAAPFSDWSSFFFIGFSNDQAA